MLLVFYGFLGFEYWFCLKVLICSVWELCEESCLSEVKFWLQLLSVCFFNLLMTWLALCCFVHMDSFLFVIWVLCNLKLVEVIHANVPVPTIRGFGLRVITCLRSIFALDIVFVSVGKWAVGC